MIFRLFALPLLLLTTACATGARGSGDADAARAPEGMSAGEFEAIYQARVDSARTRFTPADVAFMTGMIVHHSQALVMARLVPERAASQAIRTLGARIINAQNDEIASMERWLRDREQPVPVVHIDGIEVHVQGADHVHAMPGMVTADQMRALEAARGPEFDRLFLTLMIEHHRGAVTMVDQLVGTDGAAQDTEVFKLASDIQADQTTEINRMASMLASLDRFGEIRM